MEHKEDKLSVIIRWFVWSLTYATLLLLVFLLGLSIGAKITIL